MKIGLYNLEPKIENTAMMQVSYYHKLAKDEVEIYDPNHKYNMVYCFSIFTFTPKDTVRGDFICGGSGFSNESELPYSIRESGYDYSIFPECKTSYVWFSRGRIRKCPYCIVPKKEGFIKPVLPKNLNPHGEYISVMDNNFFANPLWEGAIVKLREWNKPVLFQQGIDIRILNDKQCEALKTIKIHKQIHFAWDNPKEDVTLKIELLKKYIKPYKLMCYVLIGYWSTPEEDLYRVETLRSLKIDPSVMPYDKFDRYQKNFAR